MRRAPASPWIPAPSPRAVAIAAAALASIAAAACSSSSSATPGAPDASADSAADAVAGGDAKADDAAASDASPADAAADVDKSATCASTFGSGLTNAFGRVDGTVVAVVPPNDQACALPNRTHLVIQVQMSGAVYRMVVDVLSNQGSPDVLIDEIDAPLAAGDWEDGWHPGVALDYVSTLAVHSGAFTAMHQADLVAKITSEIGVGDRISVFGTSDGEPNSTHLIHRNATNADGAIVVHPDTAPHYILLRFDEQAF